MRATTTRAGSQGAAAWFRALQWSMHASQSMHYCMPTGIPHTRPMHPRPRAHVHSGLHARACSALHCGHARSALRMHPAPPPPRVPTAREANLQRRAYPCRHGAGRSSTGLRRGPDRHSELLAHLAVRADFARKVVDVTVAALDLSLGSAHFSKETSTVKVAGVICGLVLHLVYIVIICPGKLDVRARLDSQDLCVCVCPRAIIRLWSAALPQNPARVRA